MFSKIGIYLIIRQEHVFKFKMSTVNDAVKTVIIYSQNNKKKTTKYS